MLPKSMIAGGPHKPRVGMDESQWVDETGRGDLGEKEERGEGCEEL
jgi:hypothetical protein